MALFIVGIIWSSFEDSLRVYSVDGMCFSLALDKSESLIITEDDSSRLRSLIQEKHKDNLEVDESIEPEDIEEDEDHKIILYGAASSFNSLYDCILYNAVKPYDMNYITLTDESCTVLIRSIPEGNDETTLEDISSLFGNSTSIYHNYF